MGIKSKVDLSGTVINGVTLGEPATTETGEYHWDGGVPEGEVTDLGVFQSPNKNVDGSNVPDVPLTDLVPNIKFPEWEQPVGAHDAIKAKTVVFYKGELWVSLIDANVWEPGVSGWRRFSEDPNVIQPYVQPTGAHDAYKKGDKVSYKGSNYESLIDANVWAPDVYPAGWKKI